MILISACLIGLNCRYDGKSSSEEFLIEKVRRGDALPVCPEQLGGLPTPRIPAEIVGGTGEDVLSAPPKFARPMAGMSHRLSCEEQEKRFI